MIDRFNFYDLYGYLLPGLVIVALIGLPLAMIAGKLPSSEFVSALFAVIVGYVVGQLAHSFARALFEETRPFAAKVENLSDEEKNRLRQRLAVVAGRRVELTEKSVFDICRRALQDQKRGQLADQFQGMYALTRGLCLAFFMAAPYYAGVCCAGLLRRQAFDWRWLLPFAGGLAWLGFAYANKRGDSTKSASTRIWQKRMEATVGGIVLAILGGLAGTFVPFRPNRFEAFGATVPFLLLFGLRMYRVFREHDGNVAKTVLSDFLVEPPAKAPSDDKK